MMISGGTLVETVDRMAAANCAGDLEQFLQATIDECATSVTHRRPEEIIAN
ncbi:hypothetical protein FOB84_22090 [Gordonia bronchialis]|uniref:hypothetical protein n=1 Tax=Gordonia bronchialis TaxID=2054 RepID=UPI0002FB0EBB|nr:hypothetical protein [Gordonia bronchialis]MCC3322461.1 hypothetical protein [Gordonia bronchialis]QGS26415.1 hypothetical protein FOB84_22090 [Gordonia bronchialis]